MLHALVAVSTNYHALLLHTWDDSGSGSWRKIFDLFQSFDPLFIGMHPPVKPGIYLWTGDYTIRKLKSKSIDAVVDWYGQWEKAPTKTISRFQQDPLNMERTRPKPFLELLKEAKTSP